VTQIAAIGMGGWQPQEPRSKVQNDISEFIIRKCPRNKPQSLIKDSETRGAELEMSRERSCMAGSDTNFFSAGEVLTAVACMYT
jgi:hypothetical protein